MKVAIAALAILLLLATLLPYVRREAWWIRVFDFPRLQVLVLALVTFALWLMFVAPWTWSGAAALAAVAVTAAVQARSIFPYTRLARKEVRSATQPDPQSAVSLLVANVLMKNRSADRLLRLIVRYEPDLVLLLEPDGWWEAHMRELEERGYTYTLKEPLDNRYGMLLYSRLPLVEPQVKYLLREGVPSMHMRVRLRGGAQVWLHAVHPEPPSPTEADSSLPRDAELLIVAREVAARDQPTVVAGDLNDVAWSYTTTLFQKISRLLDPRKGRGMFNTFNAKLPLVRWPLDHVFHSDHFLLGDIQRLPAFGSDHFPVYVRLLMQPGAEDLHEAPAADAQDAQEAEQVLAKAESMQRG